MADLIQRLQATIDAADHKPGEWHSCCEQNARICVLPKHLHKPEAKTFWDSIRRFGEVHGGIARELSAGDIALVLEAVNGLPELLALARDGLKYRDLAASEKNDLTKEK